MFSQKTVNTAIGLKPCYKRKMPNVAICNLPDNTERWLSENFLATKKHLASARQETNYNPANKQTPNQPKRTSLVSDIYPSLQPMLYTH